MKNPDLNFRSTPGPIRNPEFRKSPAPRKSGVPQKRPDSRSGKCPGMRKIVFKKSGPGVRPDFGSTPGSGPQSGKSSGSPQKRPDPAGNVRVWPQSLILIYFDFSTLWILSAAVCLLGHALQDNDENKERRAEYASEATEIRKMAKVMSQSHGFIKNMVPCFAIFC